MESFVFDVLGFEGICIVHLLIGVGTCGFVVSEWNTTVLVTTDVDASVFDVCYLCNWMIDVYKRQERILLRSKRSSVHFLK